MTEGQYKKAIEIHNRLKALESVKKEINDSTKHKLSYAYRYSDGDWGLCANCYIRQIGDILDRHDIAIRQEIDDEI